MTTKELADRLSPLVREAVARSKDEILGGMPPLKRAAVWAVWPLVLAVGVPMVTRINLEFALDRYHKYMEPFLGPLVASWLAANKDSTSDRTRTIAEYLSVLDQPAEDFLPVVQELLEEEEGRTLWRTKG